VGKQIKMKREEKEHFEELLPWLANGTLDKGEQDMMQQYADNDPACSNALAAEQNVASNFHNMRSETETELAPANWLAVRNRLIEEQNLSDLEDSKARQADNKQPAKRSWLAPVQDWFQKHGAVGGFAVAQMAALVAIFVFPSAILGTGSEQEQADYRVYSDTPVAVSSEEAGNIIIAFNPDITEQALRETLANADAKIVGGPTAMGGYFVRVDPSKRDSIIQKLQNSDAVTIAEAIEKPVQ
jgi:hypothetical protein